MFLSFFVLVKMIQIFCSMLDVTLAIYKYFFKKEAR
jgi:hypothetical protein